MVRVLTSHQLGPGFDSGVDDIMWVELVAGSLSCSERFFSWHSIFSLSRGHTDF